MVQIEARLGKTVMDLVKKHCDCEKLKLIEKCYTLGKISFSQNYPQNASWYAETKTRKGERWAKGWFREMVGLADDY